MTINFSPLVIELGPNASAAINSLVNVLKSDQQTLTRIESKVDALTQKETTMAATLDDVVTQVTAQKTVIDGAVTLLNNLSAMLTAAKNDPVKIQAIADQLSQQDTALAAAITANTPSA